MACREHDLARLLAGCGPPKPASENPPSGTKTCKGARCAIDKAFVVAGGRKKRVLQNSTNDARMSMKTKER
jgi:hypothetical protein